jgi:transmembrane sensor
MIKAYLETKLWYRRLLKAAYWRVRYSESGSQNRTGDLCSWLADSQNRAAFGSISRAWDTLADSAHLPEVQAVRNAALRNMRAVSKLSAIRRAAPWSVVAVSCALFLATTFLVWHVLSADKPIVYATSTGESRIVSLTDGSRMTMDAATTIRIDKFSRHYRSLSLLKGRARFDVAHDTSRPFTVKVGAQTVIAVGTAFSVELLSVKTLVTLDEGVVVIRSSSEQGKEAERSVWLTPGQELVATRGGGLSVSNIDLIAADAWRHGHIVLTDEPLDETIEQINRYLTVPVAVDPAVAKLKVSGIFNVGDLNTFVGALTSYFPVNSRLQNGHVVLESRN